MQAPARTPDLTAALPGLRAFRWYRDTNDLRSMVLPYVWTRNVNVADHLGVRPRSYVHAWMAAQMGMEAPVVEEHETPTPGCECGFYGWYPWAETRWQGVTPLDVPRELYRYVRPHPALRDAVQQWWWALKHRCNLSTGPSAVHRDQGIVTVMGVIDSYGKVVLHDHGVRSSKAAVRALIDPRSVVEAGLPKDMSTWQDIIAPMQPHAGQPKLETLVRTWPDELERIGEVTYRAARALGVPVIMHEQALALEREWGAIKDRITKNASGGLPG